MTNIVGQATTYSTILPNNKAFSRIKPKSLSSEAKFRLLFIDNYRNITHNVNETCRLFDIARSLFYKWYKRFNPYDLSTLENRSSRPHRVRTVKYNTEVVSLIRKYRQCKDTATYSAKKLACIIHRDYPDQLDLHVSAATIGRIIRKYNLFFAEIDKKTRKRPRYSTPWKKRKPAGIHTKLSTARTLIEFDMKHVYVGGKRYYAFCAIDVFTRESLIHVATTASSRQARLALEKVTAVFGKSIAILNDNGSENLGEAYAYLKEHGITQYFARPYQPKDKPYVERIIGTFQSECLNQWGADITNLVELDYYTARWLNNYHYFRPHDSLNELTPEKYCDTLGITIERRKVSTR